MTMILSARHGLPFVLRNHRMQGSGEPRPPSNTSDHAMAVGSLRVSSYSLRLSSLKFELVLHFLHRCYT